MLKLQLPTGVNNELQSHTISHSSVFTTGLNEDSYGEIQRNNLIVMFDEDSDVPDELQIILELDKHGIAPLYERMIRYDGHLRAEDSVKRSVFPVLSFNYDFDKLIHDEQYLNDAIDGICTFPDIYVKVALGHYDKHLGELTLKQLEMNDDTHSSELNKIIHDAHKCYLAELDASRSETILNSKMRNAKLAIDALDDSSKKLLIRQLLEENW